ncbi:unnamed protein product [Paramecium primaurelia]|uniref:Uncharacterized protein n=1 Tax=Paramecium primaurelia TaxID=5886 RepID=A0A8S1MNL0_PARPR|nr:unnamed protein product [Paramecium primaurelia]
MKFVFKILAKYVRKINARQFKMKLINLIPNIIFDPKLVYRRKTYEIFTKISNSQIYYMNFRKHQEQQVAYL